MKFNSKYITFTILVSAFASGQAIAQQSSNTTVVDINYLQKSNPWLNANNAAGLTSFNGPNTTDAAVFFKKEDGDFRNYFQSNNSQTFGVTAKSLTRLNNKVVFSGGFGYQNFKGKNMSGSAFINPYQMPFDIVELDEANRGTKQLETYNLNGAVGAQITNKLSVGGKLNYQAANYAKRKDLRHTNKLLDMDLSIGALYKLTEAIEIGANYNYDRRIESLSFKRFGNTDKQYLSLISYGSFYGRQELFGDYGYTASANTNPLKDISHGAALQVNFKLSNNVKWFNEFSFADRNGFFGEEGTSSIMLTKHNGLNLAYNGQVSINRGKNQHHIGLNISNNYLENSETIYRRVTSSGGVNEIVYYGNKPVYEGEILNADLNYDRFIDVKNNRPTWAINFAAAYANRNKSVNFYPYYRDQKNERFEFSGNVKKQYQFNENGFNIGLGFAYATGTGKVALDGTVADVSSGFIAPATMPLFLNQEFEYFTSSTINGNIALQYDKAIQNNLNVYIKLKYAHTYAPDVTYLGKHFNATNLSVGCNF